MKIYAAGLLVGAYLAYLCSATAKEMVCGFPGSPAYGYVRPDQEAYEEGDVVAYKCRVGYILLGSPLNSCNEDGTWTEEVPVCAESMTTLGIAFSTPTLPGHAAELAIDRDKETCSYLKPKKPRWWRIDLGKVYKILKVAVSMISSDENVKFTISVIKTIEGSASYKRCASFSGKFGTQTVVLSCPEGKGVEGEKVHIEDHLQTEGLFEICEVEVMVEKKTGYDCGTPSRNLYSITYARKDDLVEYGCIRGYEIKGRDYRICQSTGQWSDDPPVCEPVICDELDDLENGHIKLSHKNGEPLAGTRANYYCDEGYKLIPPIYTRICQKDGSWSKTVPQCEAIRCPVLDGKDVGGIYALVNRSTSLGSMALLKCKRGVKLEGDNPYIICTDDATWTKPQARCILPAGVSQVEPTIANQGAIIFGMIVAAVMIVVVLVAMYLYLQKNQNGDKPELPRRFTEPPAPPPRPPPRGDFKQTLMGFISRDSNKPEDQRELQSTWKSPDRDGNDRGSPSVVQVEVMPQEEQKRTVYPVPEENESTSLENVVLDVDNTDGSPKGDRSAGSDYAAVDYEKKRQSRLLKEQDSVDSSSTAAASPIPPDDTGKKGTHSPTPAKNETEEESEVEEEEEEEDEEEQRKAKEEEERKKKEEEELKKKEEEERKKREEEERKAKEEAEKKEKEAAAGSRRRRLREEPPPPEEEKPVTRRFRRY